MTSRRPKLLIRDTKPSCQATEASQLVVLLSCEPSDPSPFQFEKNNKVHEESKKMKKKI